MLQTLAITDPIYLVIALGSLASRHGVFAKADMRVLGAYVVKFALPALIFTALSQRPVGEIWTGASCSTTRSARWRRCSARSRGRGGACAVHGGREPAHPAADAGAGRRRWRRHRQALAPRADAVARATRAQPLAVGLMVRLLPPSDPMLRAGAFVFASMPMFGIYPILAQKYGFEGFCAAALLLATVFSFVTVSAILLLLGPSLGWLP